MRAAVASGRARERELEGIAGRLRWRRRRRDPVIEPIRLCVQIVGDRIAARTTACRSAGNVICSPPGLVDAAAASQMASRPIPLKSAARL